MEKNSFKGNISRPYIITDERTINIDTPIDWLLAESIVKQFGNPLKEHNFG
jgi:CMP-N-acetylneuraminic acid synthetase